MKRTGNLYPKIADRNNLELAFWKAQRGKSCKSDVIAFRENLNGNLVAMQYDFLTCNWQLGNYHYFEIHDPKMRTICASDFRERVMQHAVNNICEPVFERYQIFDSYANRKGKGVDACLKRTKYFCGRYTWYLKLDIHKYFDSINHEILLDLLARHFKDEKLLDFYRTLLNTYETSGGCGLPIGNLASQHFANMYLATLDHKIKEEWHVPGYVRYMDDFILFSNDREELNTALRNVRQFLHGTLDLELNEPCMNKTSHGIPFLSYLVYPNKLRLSMKAKRRFVRKMKLADRFESAEHALPLIAFMKRADSLSWRQKVLFGISRIGLEPRVAWRKLEQQRQELPGREPEQQRPVEPEQQQRVPVGSRCQLNEQDGFPLLNR